MLPLLRAGLVAALVAFSSFSTHAADKAYVRDDLADSAIRLEAQIKKDTGPVTKPVATLRREADAAFSKQDYRAGMQTLSQVVVAAPDDATSWLRLSRAILQLWDPQESQRIALMERAATAAYIAYQRTKSSSDEAEALITLSRTFADRK